MADHVVLLTIPGLRSRDLGSMPRLRTLAAGGDAAELVPSFPAVTCSVQANMTTGAPPSEHGVVANGFFWRERGEVEMWTSPADCILRPQLWDLLRRHDRRLTSAVWFPLHSKQCGADYVCTPAPIHNPDGSESLWCYTRPESLYGELVDRLGHFPLHHFWGPLANVKGTEWIVSSAIIAAERWRPHLFDLYLPHLDYAAQKSGPDSLAALAALGELDEQIGRLVDGFAAAYGEPAPLWLVAGEYAITPVDHVSYPNRALREAGLLTLRDTADGRVIDYAGSPAWALVDHQFSHVFVRDRDAATIRRVGEVLRAMPGIADVFAPGDAPQYDLQHPRSGELIAVSEPTSWQAYYWWESDAEAPAFARTVDIHKKPGYDPAEMHVDMSTRGISLDATLVKGSHGAPALDPSQRTVLLSSERGVFVERPMADCDVADVVLRQFGI
ncbi:MAG: alkaline phosphatase family protein [Pirellulales bacterium]|nr:alkaline phosphatase family protein [Pirellulales bacterium]